MSWTAPRTVAAFQRFRALFWNAEVRDNLNLLKTNIDDLGHFKTQLWGAAFASGQGNTGGGEDELTSFSFSIPADFLNAAGESLYIDAVALLGTGDTKTLRLYVGGGTAVTLFAAATDSLALLIRLRITRRTASSGACTGSVWTFSTASSPVAVSAFLAVNSGLGTVDWTAAQTLKWTAESSSSTTADMKLLEVDIHHSRGQGGTIV